MQIALEAPDQPEVIALIAALDAYQGALYPPESNYHLSIDALRQPNVLFAVARDRDGAAVACGAVVMLRAYGELKRMYVDPAQRGLGVAQQLLQCLENHAAQRGCPVLRLETGIHQRRAIAFYASAGYGRCGRYGDYPVDPLSVYMEKTLASAGSGSDSCNSPG